MERWLQAQTVLVLIQDHRSPVLQVLLFPNNLFSSLAWSSFQRFPEIYEVDLTGNQVSPHPAGPGCCCLTHASVSSLRCPLAAPRCSPASASSAWAPTGSPPSLTAASPPVLL